MPQTLLDAHGQPLASFNAQNNRIKTMETLLGICRGLIADNQLTDQEIVFLDTWLRDNEPLLHDWPASVIRERVNAILADGIITTEEADDLKDTLAALVGDTSLTAGAVSETATRLPVNSVRTLPFEGRLFCLTGKFVYGTRQRCEQAVLDRGARVAAAITTNLDYLVIGTLASRDWAHTSYGRKIEKAVEYQQKGYPLLIVSEEDWTRHLTAK